MDMGSARFAALMRAFLADHFKGFDLKIYGDPAGDQRAQTDETTPYQIMRANGIQAYPGPTNDPIIRIESVEGVLNRMVDGAPGMLIDPSCTTLRQGFRSGYHYRRLQTTGEARYETSPHKNKFSHVHDSLQYLMTGAGEGRLLMGNRAVASAVADRDFNVWDMRGSKRKTGWSNLRRGGL